MHIHSCLSPCADLKMAPREVMKKAAEKELMILGICDHNSCENAASFMAAGEKRNISVFPGIEVCTAEEAHVLALFENLDNAMKLQKIIYENLDGTNDEGKFGVQMLVNECGEPVGINERLLIGATNLPIENVVETIHSLGGVAIASHIDREAFSIIGQLGFIPDNLELDAIELSKHVRKEEFQEWQKDYMNFPILSASDAHFLEEIGQGLTTFCMEEANLDELKKAINKEGGRDIAGWLD